MALNNIKLRALTEKKYKNFSWCRNIVADINLNDLINLSQSFSPRPSRVFCEFLELHIFFFRARDKKGEKVEQEAELIAIVIYHYHKNLWLSI